MLARKFKPPEDKESKFWCCCWSEDEAQRAWDDLHSAEPCITIAQVCGPRWAGEEKS